VKATAECAENAQKNHLRAQRTLQLLSRSDVGARSAEAFALLSMMANRPTMATSDPTTSVL
jgi:hypothetical protein